jgi:tetratricopeptide (TPR) repeat protein
VGLAGLYGTTGRLDPGLARAEEALKVNLKSQSAVMHVGLLRERKVDIRKAMEAYERVLPVNPRFAPAANNLAYLLIENSGDKERAPAAQTAKEVAPEDSKHLGYPRLDPPPAPAPSGVSCLPRSRNGCGCGFTGTGSRM